MTAVAVWVGVNEDKSVVESCCNFIRLIGRMLDPVSDIIYKVFQRNLDHVGINAYVLPGFSVLSCPFPNPAKHTFVQVIQKFEAKYRAIAFIAPALGFNDINLFSFVEFSAQCDVRRNKAFKLFWRKRSLTIIFGEKWAAHSSFQNPEPP